jgi:uncharacterized membrane protein
MMARSRGVEPQAPANQSRDLSETIDRGVLALSRYWLGALIAYGAVLTALPVAAPMLKTSGLTSLSSPIYFAYSFICHQRPDRSFHIHGEQMAFCARDLAIFGGAVLVALLYGVYRRFARAREMPTFMLVLTALPMAIDGLTQLAGFRESSWELRVLTGLLFSIGAGWFVLPRMEAGFASLRGDIALRSDEAHPQRVAGM